MTDKYSINKKTLSVREARAQFATLINQASELGFASIVTKYNEPVAMIVPISHGEKLTRLEKKQQALDSAAGLWRDRKESAVELARTIRDKNDRYEKIFD